MKQRYKKIVVLLLITLMLLPQNLGAIVAQAATEEENPDIPVLLYHKIVENASNNWNDTSIEKFENTMKYLDENGYTTLTAEQYVSIMDGEESAPEKPILLTFDDATPDFIKNALPILDKYEMNAVLFVISDWINGGYSMSEADLKSLVDRENVSLQNHTKTHGENDVWENGVGGNSSITKELATSEIKVASEYLKSITGEDPVLMAYPFGSYNDNAKTVNEENGIKYAFKVGYPNDGDYAMGRHYVRMETTLAEIAEWVGGPVPEVEEDIQTEIRTVYHEDFSDGQGLAKQSGKAKLTPVSDKVFSGNDDGAALYVSDRAEGHDAVDFFYDEIGLEDGKSYSITVEGYVDEGVDIPEGAQAFLQAADISYGWLGAASFVAGESFTLTGKLVVDESKDNRIRVQSSGTDGVPFYIGDIKVTEEVRSTEPVIKTTYHETFAEENDLLTTNGAAKISWVDIEFEGNENGKGIQVINRSDNWDGVDINFSEIGIEDGKTYSITVIGYVDEETEVPEGAQALLQNVNSYDGLYLNANLEAGKSFILTGSYTADTSVDSAFRIQSNDAGAPVEYYIGEILITTEGNSGEIEEPIEDDRDPAIPFETITFEDGELAGFEGRGGNEILTITPEANHTEDGSLALKVEGREKEWNGPSLRVEQYIDRGAEYYISAWVKLISPESSQLQLSTQVGSEDFGASYNNLEGKTISVEDGWVQFEGTYRYSSVGDEFVSIYIESSNNSTASFYIDDISFVKTDSAPIEIEKNLTPIKDVYKDYFLIGNAVSTSEFDGQRLELLNLHHNLVTAENAMKPSYAYDEDGNFDFTAEDALMQMALDQGLDVHGHVLVWHQQSREALHTGSDGEPLPKAEAIANLETHVKTVVEHFGADVISWDVVNEAMNDNPANPSDWKGALRNSGWLQAIGPEYLEMSFRFAKEVIDENGWDIDLYYNDYNDDNQNKATAIYHMVKEINENYAKDHPGEKLIDGIGMQGHYNLNTNPNNVRLSLERFISLGVDVGITELDITAGSNSEQTEEELNQQAYLYAQLFSLYKEHSEHISRVTLWGLNDSSSWRAEQSPLLFDRNLQSKPAYGAVIDPEGFIENYDPVGIEAREGRATYGTPENIDGVMDEVWSSAYILPINQYQGAWSGASGLARVLWDEDNLYVFVQVTNAELDKSSTAAHEHDSVEVFLDQNNEKTSFYQEDDGQYRVNYDNESTFNFTSGGDNSEGFESATKIDGTNYTVEMKIPFNLDHIKPKRNTKIGFDVQVNDGKDGQRQSVAIWNDLSGVGYQDTSVFGNLTLVKPYKVEDGRVDFVEEEVVESEEIVIELEEDDGGEFVFNAAPIVEKNASITARPIDEKTGRRLNINFPTSIFEKITEENDEVTITVVPREEPVKNDTRVQSGIYQFNVTVAGEKTTQFADDVTIEIPVVEDSEVKTANLRLAYYDETKEDWIIFFDSKYDEDTESVVGKTDHFSTFAVLEVTDEQIAIYELQLEIDRLNDSIEDLESENADQLAELTSLRNELTQLRNALALLQDNYDEQAEINDGLWDIINQLRQDLADLKAELDALREELGDGEEPGEEPGEPGEEPGESGEEPDEPGEQPDEPGETPDEDGETPGTGDGEADEDSGPVLVDPDETDDESDDSTEKPAEKDKDGNALPATATSLFNYMLIGALVLLVGAGLALYSYKRKRA